MNTSTQASNVRVLTTKRKLVFATLAVVGFFLPLELGARLTELLRPIQPIDYELGFSGQARLFVDSPGDESRMMTNPLKLDYFQNQEFSRKKDPSVVRIMAIGGSSVNLQQHEFTTLKSELGSEWRRPVEIINAGGHSYGSHRLVTVLNELVEYEPDLVLIYSGNNEFEETEQLQLASLKTARLQRWLDYSALIRRVRHAVTEIRIDRIRKQHTDELKVQTAWSYDFTSADLQVGMKLFRSNLLTMIRVCQSKDIQVVIGTVPSNLATPELPSAECERIQSFLDQGQFEEAQQAAESALAAHPGRHQASGEENNVIREVADETGTPIADVRQAVHDAEPNGVPGETLFTDHCHLTDPGKKIWRRVFRDVILALPTLP